MSLELDAAIDAQEKKQEEDNLRKAGIFALGGLRAFDTFTAQKFIPTKNTHAAFEAIKSFATNIYLYGPTGSGKSHLAAIAARKDGFSGVYTITQMHLSRRIRGARDASEELAILSTYIESRILVIDDLGVGKDTEFSLSLLYEIIHGRYMNNPAGLIITSNLDLDQIAQKIGDDRISSRLAQMCKILRIDGPDQRLARRGANSI